MPVHTSSATCVSKEGKLFAIHKEHFFKKIRENNTHLRKVLLNAITLIDLRIRNFFGVNNISIHPSFLDTNLNFVSNQRTDKSEENKSDQSSLSSSSSNSDSESSELSKSINTRIASVPISRISTIVAGNTPTHQVQTYHEIRKSMIVPEKIGFLEKSKTLSSKDSMNTPKEKSLKNDNLCFSDENKSTAFMKGRASNIELSALDVEFLMHNYSNSDLRK